MHFSVFTTFRKSLKAGYKCRPSALRTKISCEGESLSISCSPPLRIAIASSKFSGSPSSLLYCPPKYSKSKESSCDDLSVTSQVSSLCHGQHECSVLADPVILAIMSGVQSIKPSIACHKNYSALRTTSACVHEQVFIPELLNKLSPSTESPIITQKIHSFLSTTSHISIEYSTISQLSLNHSKSSQEIEAKPLEPKPAIIDILKNDVKSTEVNTHWDLTEVFLFLTIIL